MTPGKRVLDDLYIHIDAAKSRLDAVQYSSVINVLERVTDSARPKPNVLKLNLRTGRFSLLAYPGFETSPFPELAASWAVADSGSIAFRTYEDSLNPPVLHRKELLVPDDWPERTQWATLTHLAESIGLFDDTRAIGFRLNWQRLLASKGYRAVGHELLPLGNFQPANVEPLHSPVNPSGMLTPAGN